MNKISTCLWFDDKAEEVANFYVSIFDNSKINNVHRYVAETPSNKPVGSVMTVDFEIEGFNFTTLNGGSFFKTNPSISFILNFDPSKDSSAEEDLTNLWNKLIEGGKALMPLQKYPFSDKYGWVEDKYGVSWQLILSDPKGEDRPFITPSLMFVGNNTGKAEEATDFYLSVFSSRGGSASGGKDSRRGQIARYPAGMEPDKEGTIMYTDFMIENQWFAAMDSAQEHKFNFSEGISLMVQCKDQEEIDYYWNKLSAVPESEQCGWLKDKYGLSWQIVPEGMDKMFDDLDKEKAKKAMESFLKMKKIDIEKLGL